MLERFLQGSGSSFHDLAHVEKKDSGRAIGPSLEFNYVKGKSQGIMRREPLPGAIEGHDNN